MHKTPLHLLPVFLLFPLLVNTAPAFAMTPTTTSAVVVSGEPTRPLTLPGKLQLCQAHENFIKLRLNHIQTLLTKETTDFDRIAIRTETYYTTNLLPKGKTVTNYTQLVADIATKKAAALATITPLKTDISSFSCTETDPKTVLTKFQTDLKDVRAALQAYRVSTRNLIVAIRSIRGTAYSDNKLTPKPSVVLSTTPMVSITLH